MVFLGLCIRSTERKDAPFLGIVSQLQILRLNPSSARKPNQPRIFKNEFKNWVGCSFTHDGSIEGINPASYPPSRNTLYPIYARAPKWLFPTRGGMLRSLLQGGASWNLRKNLVTDTSQLVQRRCDQLGHIIFFLTEPFQVYVASPHSKTMVSVSVQ